MTVNEQAFIWSPCCGRVRDDGSVHLNHPLVAHVHAGADVVRMPGAGRDGNPDHGTAALLRGWFAQRRLTVLAENMCVLQTATTLHVADFVCESSMDDYMFFVFTTERCKRPTRSMCDYAGRMRDRCMRSGVVAYKMCALNVYGGDKIRCFNI